MGQRKPYNPNTKYGRKKLREQAAENYANMTPAEKAEHDQNGCIVMIIIAIVVGGLIYWLAGPEAMLKWFSR